MYDQESIALIKSEGRDLPFATAAIFPDERRVAVMECLCQVSGRSFEAADDVERPLLNKLLRHDDYPELGLDDIASYVVKAVLKNLPLKKVS